MMVRCDRHGRVYDNAAERGCPLCIQGAPATENLPRTPKLARATLVNLIILGVLLVGGGGVWFFVLREPPPPPPAAPAVVDTFALLDEGEAFADSSDMTPIRQARAYATALERLYADRAPILRFAEGPVDTAATGAARTRARQYAQFSARWQARVDQSKPDSQLFFRPGARYATQVESASNLLGAARSAFRQAAPPAEVPPLAERQRLLAAARGYLNSARTTLSELP